MMKIKMKMKTTRLSQPHTHTHTQRGITSCERYSLAKAFSVATVFQVVRDNLGPTIISVVGCVRLSRKQAKRRQFRALMACSYTDFLCIISEVYQIDFF